MDRNSVQEAQSMGEYAHKKTMGIRDTKKDIELFHVDKYLKPFIPLELGTGDRLERRSKLQSSIPWASE